MTLYRPSRRQSKTWHVVANDIEDRAICGTTVRQEARDAYTARPFGFKLCVYCRREAFPVPPRINVGELLLTQHLDELGCEFVEQYLYVPGRRFQADFAILSHRILIEINGGRFMAASGHSGPSGIQRDNERLNHAALHNWRVLRFTPDEVKAGIAKEWVRKVLTGEVAK